MTKAR